MAGDRIDVGWNCRDHAWTLAFLLQFFGIDSAVAHGQAFFASGPTAKQEAVSYTQVPHSWLIAKNLGAIDLSIKPVFVAAGDRFSVPIKWVFLNGAAPGKCEALFFTDENAYRRATRQLPERRNRMGAAYLAEGYERLEQDHFESAARWMDSSLTRQLLDLRADPSGLYAALLAHLTGFLQGQTPSLTALPFRDAWSALADRQPPSGQPSSGIFPSCCQRPKPPRATPGTAALSGWSGPTPDRAASCRSGNSPGARGCRAGARPNRWE